MYKQEIRSCTRFLHRPPNSGSVSTPPKITSISSFSTGKTTRADGLRGGLPRRPNKPSVVKQLGLVAVARRLLVMINAMVRDGVDCVPAPVT
jgi:hypothetical protein